MFNVTYKKSLKLLFNHLILRLNRITQFVFIDIIQFWNCISIGKTWQRCWLILTWRNLWMKPNALVFFKLKVQLVFFLLDRGELNTTLIAKHKTRYFLVWPRNYHAKLDPSQSTFDLRVCKNSSMSHHRGLRSFGQILRKKLKKCHLWIALVNISLICLIRSNDIEIIKFQCFTVLVVI